MATRTKRVRKQFEPFAFDFDALARCEHSQDFNDWVGEWLFPEIVNEAIEDEDVKKAITALNKAILMLVMKYFSYEGIVPMEHWTCRSEPDEHVCLWRIFHQTYRRLEALLHSNATG